MDIEYVADVAAERVRDYILYDKNGNHNSPEIVRKRYAAIRTHLGGIVGIDELES